MKIRQGFVSNSSSSSFVVAGVQLSEQWWKSLSEDARDHFYNNHTVLLGSDDGVDDGTVVIGDGLASFDEFDTEFISVDEINASINSMMGALDGGDVLKQGIFTGTRYC